MFNRILVPLDGSPLAERALAHAEHFARVFQGTIILLQVLDPSPFHESPSAVEPLNWQIRKAEAEMYVRDIAARLRDRQIPAEATVLEGRTPENIIDFAHSQNIDLLVLSSHGASGLSRWNSSSITTKVLAKAYLPVLLIRSFQEMATQQSATAGTDARTLEEQTPAMQSSQGGATGASAPAAQTPASPQSLAQTQTQMNRQYAQQQVPVTAGLPPEIHYRRILLPIDSSRRAECALPAGTALLQGEVQPADQDSAQATETGQADPKLILAAVLRPPELPLPAPYPDDLQQQIDQLMRLSRQALQGALDEMKNRLPVPAETRMVENDSIPEAIHELAEQSEADLVVLCAHGHAGRFTWPYGSVASNYLEHGLKPVLVIQDIPREQVRPTAAEQAAEKYGRR